jgi:hypothetical protein
VIAVLLGGFAASPWMRAALRYAATVLAVILFLHAFRRSGERAGRLAERLDAKEKTRDAQRRMLEAVARRPRSRDDLAERLRGDIIALVSKGVSVIRKPACQRPSSFIANLIRQQPRSHHFFRARFSA